ncbi:MAG TPA: tRNA (adenosine(37)-N6)-threonylcarbamoyltransferase complex dimerization subunit type 1 TsaB, partial [Blastocatellia bacterium]
MADQDYKSELPLVLALDTSSRLTSLAVSRGPHVIKSIKVEADERRSEKLWVDIESLLIESTVTVNDIDLFGVCVGPGGFTGLRVGMSAAKGLASATRRPIIGVTSLEAAAMQAGPGRIVCALVNAYKGEVYSQHFSIDKVGVPVALNAPFVSTLGKALGRADVLNTIVFTGDAALEGAELIRQFGGIREQEEVTRGEARRWTVESMDQPAAARVAR